MQKPFWKLNGNIKLIEDLKKVIDAANEIGIELIVIPLVDNGSLSKKIEVQNLLKICKSLKKYLQKTKIKLVFESDFNPKALQRFIKNFDKKYFGINYDVGNSAALNYNIDEEFNLYGNRIYNVHIKDRIKFGKTVRLGNGNANFLKLFKNLKKIKYAGNLILQTARSEKNRHLKEIEINLDYLKKFHNA